MTYFSVVIPTYNRLPMLMRVLDALQNQVDAPPSETIVIDDGSTDDTAATAGGRSDITFRSQPNSGPGQARNEGVRLAKGKFVVFIGDDTVPEPGWLAAHLAAHAARPPAPASRAPGDNLDGDYLLPGLVELHTDHLEGHYAPRPKVRWNPIASVLAHDAQVATAGITTVFDALRERLDDARE